MAYLENIAVFIRVLELGNFTAAGRDMRISPAVVSTRVKALERHLGVRLFNRTTRQLMPTEHGTAFYTGAKNVLDAISEAEAAVTLLSGQPRGTIRVTAPFGLGRRIVASGVPEFHDHYPDIKVRLRLSDHNIDIVKEGIDVAFRLGDIEDSSLCLRGIVNCERVLVASPEYLKARGEPKNVCELLGNKHDCLLLRYPGSREFYWTLQTEKGQQVLELHGPFDSDDGDVLTDWALAGRGIVNKPLFEVARYVREGRLSVILPQTPPASSQLAAVYPHKKLQDPKVRLLVDFMAERCQRVIQGMLTSS